MVVDDIFVELNILCINNLNDVCLFVIQIDGNNVAHSSDSSLGSLIERIKDMRKKKKE